MGHLVVWEHSGLLITFVGRMSGSDVLELTLAIQADARTRSIRYALNDFTRCELIPPFDEPMSTLAACDWVAAHTRPLVKIALFPDRPDVRGIAQAYSSNKMSPWPVRVFDAVDAARQWAVSRHVTGEGGGS